MPIRLKEAVFLGREWGKFGVQENACSIDKCNTYRKTKKIHISASDSRNAGDFFTHSPQKRGI